MMADECDGDTFHAACLGRFHTGYRVFQHDATVRRYAESVRGDLEHLRVGLTSHHARGILYRWHWN
jgi:hypothetical protein